MDNNVTVMNHDAEIMDKDIETGEIAKSAAEETDRNFAESVPEETDSRENDMEISEITGEEAPTAGEKNYSAIIEAILFTMGESVELEKIAAAIELDKKETKAILEAMMAEYERQGRGIAIMELDGAYQMCTRTEMYEYLIRIAKQPKKRVLTDVLLETLSIIAYKQPVTKSEIEKIRGVSSDHAVSKLVEYNLVCELGRLDAPGRPLLFGTTEEFLRSFGVHSIDDLPVLSPVQIEEYKQEAEAEMKVQLDI